MWAVPLGIGLSLFSGDLIEFVIGEHWRDAEILLVTFGITAAVSHIGFNWSAFYRAARARRSRRRSSRSLVLGVFLAVATPLLFAYDLDGFAAGTGAMAVAADRRALVLPEAALPGLRHRALRRARLAPTDPAAAAVCSALRLARRRGALRSGSRSASSRSTWRSTSALTLALERALLAEALEYLRRPRHRLGVLPALEGDVADREPLGRAQLEAPALARPRRSRRSRASAPGPDRGQPEDDRLLAVGAVAGDGEGDEARPAGRTPRRR